MRRAVSLLLLVAAVLLVGCGSHFQYVKLAPKSSVHSIVSLSPGLSEVIGGTAPQLLKGRTQSCDWPQSILSVPVVGSVKPDYEAFKRIGPDLIVYDASLYSPSDIDKIKGLGFDTMEFDAKTVDQFIDELFKFGNVVAQQTNISDYVDRIRVEEGDAKGDPPQPTPKVAVVMPGGGGSMMIAGTQGFVADVVKICGGDIVGPSTDKFVPLNAETLVSDDPDVILIPTSSKTVNADVPAVLNDPKLQSVSAVKNKKVVALDQDVVLREGDRVDKFINAVHLALTAKAGH